MAQQPDATRSRRELVGIFALFALLTVVISWPLLVRLDEVLIGNDNDTLINVWADWWTLQAWQQPDVTLYQTDVMFYPHGANLVYHSFSHLNTLVSLALRPLLGILPAYNVAVLLNIYLAGVAMCHLARYLTGSTSAGIIAGVIFAFNSHAIYQTAHPVLVTIWPLPWATLSFWWAMQANSRKWAVVAAIFVFLAAAASTHLLIFCAIWFAVLIPYLLLSRSGPRPSGRILLTFGFTAAILILPLLFPLIQDALANRNNTFLIDPYNSIEADLFALFRPQWYERMPRNLYLGIAPFALLLVAVASRRKEMRLWALLSVGAFLFSIGPRPQFLGTELNITLPWSLLIVPVLRQTHRMNILLGFGLAMLAAYGWVALAAKVRSERGKRIAAALIILAIFGEYAAVPFPYLRQPVSYFYTDILPQEPADVAIAILPTGRQEDKRYMYYQTFHEHKMTGGVISRASEDTFQFIYDNPLLRAGAVNLPPMPIPEDVRPHLHALADNKITYLILDKKLMDVEPWRTVFPFPPIYEDNLLLVYETDPE